MYALIITDLSMPIMDGYEEVKEIRRFMRKKSMTPSKIVACTGHTEQAYIDKAWRYEIDEVVSKPLKVDIACEIL